MIISKYDVQSWLLIIFHQYFILFQGIYTLRNQKFETQSWSVSPEQMR